jgi:hypothetical protein
MRFSISILLLAAACTNEATDPSIKLPPHGGVRQPGKTTGNIPTQVFGFGPGTIQLNGPTTPGSATFTMAPLDDPNGPPPSVYGSGSYDVTLAPTNYNGSLESLAMLFSDPQVGDYLVFGGYNIHPGPNQQDVMDQVVVLVKQSDFAVGATVALDGEDRIALFGSGPPDGDPTTMGAAFTGSVTFNAGSIGPTGTITATLQGDFGEVDPGTQPQPGGTITAGNYTLAIQGPAEVYCDGTLAGHEADFAGITDASLGFVGGAVSVATPTPSRVTVDGTPISGAYGTSPFELDAVDASLFAGFSNNTGSGPDNTDLVGKYFVVDASSATANLIYGGAGAGYVTANQDGSCTVAFGATLTQ